MAEHLWLRHPDGSPTEAMDGYEERLRAGSHVLCGGRVLLRLTRLERLCRSLWARLPVALPVPQRDAWAAALLGNVGHAAEWGGHLVRAAPIPGDSWAHSPRILVVDYVARNGPGVPLSDVKAHLCTASGGPVHPGVVARLTVGALRDARILTVDGDRVSVTR